MSQIPTGVQWGRRAWGNVRVLWLGVFFTALGCWQSGTDSPLTSAKLPPPQPVVIEPESVVIEGTRSTSRRKRITLRNTSTVPVEIGVPEVSCACTVVSPLTKKLLRQGEVAELEIDGEPPLFGEQTASIKFPFNHPDMPFALVRVTLRADLAKIVPRIYQMPESVYVRHRPGETTETGFTFSTIERRDDQPWIQGLTTDDAAVRFSQPVVEMGLFPTAETVIRTYSIGGTIASEYSATGSSYQPVRFLAEDGLPISQRHLNLIIEVSRALRIVPEQISVSKKNDEGDAIERKVLAFFDSDERQVLQFPKPLPEGIRMSHDSDQRNLPKNATRLRIQMDRSRFDVIALGEHPKSSEIVLPIQILDRPETTFALKLRIAP